MIFLKFDTVGGFPRLMDMGQCNDAYSAIKVAAALAEAFGCGVNDLRFPWCSSGTSKRRFAFCSRCCTSVSRIYFSVPRSPRSCRRTCYISSLRITVFGRFLRQKRIWKGFSDKIVRIIKNHHPEFSVMIFYFKLINANF